MTAVVVLVALMIAVEVNTLVYYSLLKSGFLTLIWGLKFGF